MGHVICCVVPSTRVEAQLTAFLWAHNQSTEKTILRTGGGLTGGGLTGGGFPHRSSVTNMDRAFHNATNADISAWDTSSVECMSFTFMDCSSFNQDISRWDTSSVPMGQSMAHNTFGAFFLSNPAWPHAHKPQFA